MVGAEQRVDEEPGDVDVGRVDGGQVVQQRVAEVEVDAVRLVCELAQLGVALALGQGDRGGRGGRLGACARGLLGRGGFGDLDLEFVDGALDRVADELSVDGAVDDDRAAMLELDQDAGRSGPVDVVVGEADVGGP
ncbi:hypothetical protein LRS13_06280 [Svornostia abyssi]|uniref:Uncharacterized protein n=1 Tax=Svornostia abyssi TaxID=2898438 RepID=A0ABY5PKB0_9ACTN|nr:hypothetical protein LRS13_06280 [Parviterribacteraceae bacterium J379]